MNRFTVFPAARVSIFIGDPVNTKASMLCEMQRTTSDGRAGPNHVFTTFSAGSSNAAPRRWPPSQVAFFPVFQVCVAFVVEGGTLAAVGADPADADAVGADAGRAAGVTGAAALASAREG